MNHKPRSTPHSQVAHPSSSALRKFLAAAGIDQALDFPMEATTA